MRLIATDHPEVLLLEPIVHRDGRGFFFESFNARTFSQTVGFEADFVQDNHSRSSRGVLRGLHYQIEHPQGKLLRTVTGTIFDVAVDLRRGSSFFGCWTGVYLDAESAHQLWVPPGFAHGFYVISEYADVVYKSTDYYAPEHERCIIWDDPQLAVKWPLSGIAIVSERDSLGRSFSQAETFA